MAQNVDPCLAGVLTADVHSLGVAFSIREYNGKALSAVFLVALHGPANHVRIVQIIVLRTVYAVPAQVHHQVDLLVEGGAFHGLDAVIVAIKDTRVALGPQQDHCVGKGHEPGLDGTLQRLPGLCVVVVDEGDRMRGIALYQCVFQQLAHIELAAAVAGLEEVVVKRNVKQGHTSAAVPQIFFQNVHVRMPVFADGEKLLVIVGAELMEPFGEKIPRNVLDGVEPETMHICGIQIPLAPAGQFLSDLGFLVVDVGAHQIVIVDVFAVHAAIPLDAFEFVDGDLVSFIVVVYAVKTGVVPDEIGIFALSSRECEFGPRIDHFGWRDRLCTVLFFGLYDLYGLGLVRAHAVVENNVCVDIDTASL